MKKLISWVIRHVPRRYLQRVSRIGLMALGWLYAGNRVQCPVCQSRFRRFLPYGRINPRPNALCPACQSLERHRLIWLYLRQRTEFFSRPAQVLHIAPEACFMPAFKKMHGVGYLTADLESPLASVTMDIHAMPFEANRFDVVLCNHVLEHVQNDLQALREIHRVLRPGGFAILQVPFFHPVPDVTFEDAAVTDPRQREKLFGQSDHVRKYGKDYAGRLAQSGLLPQPVPFADEFSEDERFRFGLARGEVIYRANKAG
jgi:SAM-dependent methyltransferase